MSKNGMEKIFLKPETQEILMTDKSDTQRSDIFSYDYGQDDSKRQLGNLFVVGNVQNDQSNQDSVQDNNAGTESADVSYIINLVASLAKREYYAKQDLAPKEAFSSALKKINGVIEEFFKNKNLKINVGIFAIAGENINISKLGKFKILMVRDGKTIDILNNIDLFSKEVVQEKEFSHVISGKIAADDKILAFYPDRSFTAREKTIKDFLLKNDRDVFIDKIKAIKEKTGNFCCVAFYINLNKVKKPARVPKLQPEELREPYITVAAEAPADNFNRPSSDRHSQPASPRRDEAGPNQGEPVLPAANKEFLPPPEELPQHQIESPKDFPRIIPAEFSLGKKADPITLIFNKMRPFLPKPRNKIIFFVSVLGIVIVFSFTLKALFLPSPENKMANRAVNEAKTNLKLAKVKISQNDPAGARGLLMASITSLESIKDVSKTAETKERAFKVFDELDTAAPASLSLKDAPPDNQLNEFSLLAAETEKIKSGKYNLPSEMLHLNIYEGNLYILLADAIFKISDAGKNNGANEAISWLQSGAQLPENPSLIAVDGNVFVLNKAGLLSVYFRGGKIGKFNTAVLPEEKSKLLTTKDSKTLYLVNQTLGRIYLIKKESGTLEKTLVIGSSEPIENAFIGEGGVINIISKNNKIWEVR